MKKFLITGFAIMLSSGALMAQYDDDAYAPSNNRPATQEESYNDGNGSRERYSEYDENDGYIDYDDDSYTTRFRRFNSMYMGYNYWSPMYSPYWANPYYSDPFWYRPGLSFSWGMGYNPYWGSGWGWNSYWGYGGGYGWGYPYWGSVYGGGWGYPYYGGGWNNGWHGGDGGRFGRGVNTGTRNGFGSARSSSFGVRPAPGTGNPNPGTGGGYVRRGAPGSGNVGNNGNPGRINPSNNGGYMRNPGTVNGGAQRMRDNNAPAPRYNRGNDVNTPRQYDRGNTRPEPSRNYTPAPSRSFDNGGGGSRGGGGFNSGGGSRGGGGGGYRR